MANLIRTTVGELTENLDNKRIPLSSVHRSTLAKTYRYYGAQGVIDYVDDYLFDGTFLLVAEDGENLKSNRANICTLARGKFWVNNHAHILNARDDNDLEYIFYLLSIVNFANYVTGSAQPKLTKENLEAISVFAAEPPTQRQIAGVLSALDAKIELNNRINAELEALAKTIYDYWLVQFNFPDAHGRPYKSSGGAMVWNGTLKREIPAGWEARALSELGSFRNGINYDPSVGGDAVARIVNVRDVSASTVFIKHDDLDELALDQADIGRYLVTPDSILIARSGIPGATRMMQPCPPNTIYCGFIICLTVADAENKLPLFFRLKQLEQSLLSQSSGSILKNVSQDTLKEICLAVPCKRAVIERFNATVTPLFTKISANDLENAELTRLRDWLLPLLMNGQVRVGGGAP